MLGALGFKTAQFAGIMGGNIETEEDKMVAQVEVGKHMDIVIEKLREERKKAKRIKNYHFCYKFYIKNTYSFS